MKNDVETHDVSIWTLCPIIRCHMVVIEGKNCYKFIEFILLRENAKELYLPLKGND